MAFNRTPTEDTFSSQTIRLAKEIHTRDSGSTNKDEDMVNVFLEVAKNKVLGDERVFVAKRPGVSQVVASVASGAVRGCFFWADQNKFYYAVDNDVYVYNVNTGVSVTLSNPFGTTTGDVGFCLFLYDNNTSVVIATDGTTLIKIDSSNTVTTCVDADMPAHRPYPVFLDGYLFVVKTNSADIYNSNLNDPMLWTAGDFISAEMEGDYVLRIAKINNYLIAMGSTSLEYFWDSGEPSGSPLPRNDTPIKINTYLAGFAQLGNALFYIGADEGGQPSVYTLKDFKIDEIGSPAVIRYLAASTTGISTWNGSVLSCDGHSFYVVNDGGNRTYVYDMEYKQWVRWAYQANNNFNIRKSCAISTTNNISSFFSLGTTSVIYKLDASVYQDAGTNFTCTIVTDAVSFGTMNRKQMPQCTVVGDRPSSTANVLIQWSDDDYQTFNTGLSTNLNQDLPTIYRLGSFRQRIFKLTFTANEHFRVESLEVKINKGRS